MERKEDEGGVTRQVGRRSGDSSAGWPMPSCDGGLGAPHERERLRKKQKQEGRVLIRDIEKK